MASWAVMGETSNSVGRRGNSRNLAPRLMSNYASDNQHSNHKLNSRLRQTEPEKGKGRPSASEGTASSQLLFSNAGAEREPGCYGAAVQLELRHMEVPLKQYHDCSKSGCQRIIINVSGQRFETQLRTLSRYPGTLLGDPVKRKRFWDPRRNEVFIDRHRPSFQAVLYYYQSGGRLRRPFEVPEDIFIEELEFYEMDEQIIRDLKAKEGFVVVERKELPETEWQREVWLICEEPDSSRPAKAFACISVSCILVSIINFCTETIPAFAKRSNCVNITEPEGVDNGDSRGIRYRVGYDYGDPFFVVEAICVSWFIVEFALRLISCPSKRGFCRDLMNLFDLLAIVPFFVTLATMQGSCDADNARKKGSFLFTRVLRVFRIFKLSKHSHGLRILGLTIKTSMRELGMFFFFLAVAMVIFSSAAYYAEAGKDNTRITSIPEGFWWAIVTMTTVGYGDVVPIGVWGKLVGTFCVIAGVLTIALPVPVVVANFNNFYRHGSRGGGGGGLGG